MKNRRASGLAMVLLLLHASFAFGGPVILGGDDLTDHGGFNGTVNTQGWLYIQRAVQGILAGSTRPGATPRTIAALGSAPSTATSGNAGAAIGSAAAALSPAATVTYYDGAAAITTFFSNLASGATNPAMIWLAGTGSSNDLDSAEGAVLTTNAQAIAAYVASGGGLMAHGSGPDAYGWLTALIPGIVESSGCDSTGAIFTPAGLAAFPGLAITDVDSAAGPCHSAFSGNLGSLQVLVLDGSTPRLNFIIGGGAGTIIDPSTPTPTGPVAVVPTLSFPMMALFALALATLGFVLMRRN